MAPAAGNPAGGSGEGACHRLIRGICVLLITSMVVFAIINELKPPNSGGLTVASDHDEEYFEISKHHSLPPRSPSPQQPATAGGRHDIIISPPLSPEGKATPRPVPTPARDRPQQEAPGPATDTQRQGQREGEGGRIEDAVTTDADIEAKSLPVAEYFPCIGQGSSDGIINSGGNANRKYMYQFVFIPIGCFGDQITGGNARKESPDDPVGTNVTSSCRLPSCRLGTALAHVPDGCALDKVGAFLGDNFYPNGIRKWYDNRFDAELTEKFWRYPQLQMKYYSTVGNHDNPKPRAQFRDDHKYFVLPDFHHASPVLTGADGKTTVQIFSFTTHYGFDRNDPMMPAEAQWLDQQLSSETSRDVKWKIVITHEPIWGFMNFQHGKGLVEHIHPVLVKHKVRLFVCAHAHSVSIHRCPGGYYQLISAGFAEGSIHDLVKPYRPQGKFHLGHGATAVFIDEDHIDIVAFDSHLHSIWNVTIPYDDSEGSGDAAYGNASWFPPHAPSYYSDTSSEADSGTGTAKGYKDYWTVRPQCEAMLPLVPPYCRG